MRHFLKLFLIFLFIPAATHAEQRDLKGGLSYTAIARPGVPEKPGLPQNKAATTEEDAPTSRVWQKYKDLAAGTVKEEPENDMPEAQPAKPVAAEQPAPQATGFAGILQQYQERKKRQSQMRKIEVQPPETREN